MFFDKSNVFCLKLPEPTKFWLQQNLLDKIALMAKAGLTQGSYYTGRDHLQIIWIFSGLWGGKVKISAM